MARVGLARVAQVTKQNSLQKKARSKGTKKSTSTNDEGSSVRATTTQAALAMKQQPAQKKARTNMSTGTKRPEPISGEALSAGAMTAGAAQSTQQRKAELARQKQ